LLSVPVRKHTWQLASLIITAIAFAVQAHGAAKLANDLAGWQSVRGHQTHHRWRDKHRLCHRIGQLLQQIGTRLQLCVSAEMPASVLTVSACISSKLRASFVYSLRAMSV
jgi:hypothetical protein